MTFTVAFVGVAIVGVFPPTKLTRLTSNLNSPAEGFGYKLTSNELAVVVIGILIFVPAAQPVCVSDCDFVPPCVPQRDCPFTDKVPPTYPVLKRNVILELSADAAVMVVLLGFVQRNTDVGVCEVEGAPTIAV